MRRYSTTGTHSTAADTVLSVIGSASVSPAVYYISLGSTSAPADATIACSVRQFSADGTGTGVTPQAIDVNHPAAVATSAQAYSVEPTYAGVDLLAPSFNQRSHYQWYAQQGGELIANLAASDGIGVIIDSFSTGTPTIECVMHFIE